MRIRVLTVAALAAACSLSESRDHAGGASTTQVAEATASRALRAQVEGDADADADDDEREDPDEPDRAHEWLRLRWQDENGAIDPLAVAAAHRDRDANAAFHAAIDDAGIGRFGWVERGPFNIGGRTRALVINPSNGTELWAGSAGGGIWHTTNAGASWAPVDDRLGNLAVCALAIVAGTPNVLYAGTGEGYYNSDGLRGAGLFKSVDGGQTFALLPATASWQYVNRIAVHPTNPNVLLVAGRPGIWRSTDAGATWTQVRAIANCLQVLFDPNDGNRCVADCYDNTNHFVARSIDGGATWIDATVGLVAQPTISGRIELCYARSVPDMVYASCGTGGGLIWRSLDGGDTWTQQTTSAGSGAAWYYNSLWVDPTDANFVVTGAYHAYKSVDGGVTLTQFSNGYLNTQQPHPDQHGFVADPGFDGVLNRRVWIVTDGGVYFASDIRAATQTTGWSRKDNGYRASQFYGAAGDATGRITGGTQDNGSLTLQNAATAASLTFGGDGGFAAIDWLNPAFVYGEYVYAQVHRSTNGGTSAGYIYAGIADANVSANANFIAPFVLDPNDPTRMLVGGLSLWRTSNARAATVAWTSIKAASASKISAIAIAPGNANVIWVGHNDGTVWRTGNGLAAAPTWTAVDANGVPNPLPNRVVTRILIDQLDSNTVWVAFGGFTTDNLWRTNNAGATFVDVTGTGVTGLPSVPMHGLAQHPALLDHLYAATEVGVFATADGGAHWSTQNDGPGDVSVHEVAFVHGTTRLLAATHGRGLWTIDVREPVVAQAGAGCAGTVGVPILTANPPRVGATLNVIGLNLPSGAFVLTALGFDASNWNGAPLPLALDFLGMPGCFARVRPDLVTGAFATGTASSLALALPPTPSSIGSAFWLQAFVVDAAANAGGAVVSNALALTIGN